LRGEIARGLIDLLTAGRHERLTSVRTLMSSAAALEAALDEGRKSVAGAGDAAGDGILDGVATATTGTGRRRKKTAAAIQPGATNAEGESDAAADSAAPKVSASDRRAAASSLLAIWASLARDLAVAALGGRRRLQDPELLEELAAVAPTIPAGALPAFLAKLAAVEVQIDENVNPELALDVLVLAWPRPGRAA
jgi:hypothetical protein